MIIELWNIEDEEYYKEILEALEFYGTDTAKKILKELSAEVKSI